MNRKTTLTACVLLALLSATARTDDPARHHHDRTEIISDPRDDHAAAARFRGVERDEEMVGAPIVKVWLKAGQLDDDGLLTLTRLRNLRCLTAANLNTTQLGRLAQLRQLQYLLLGRISFGADTVKALAPLSGLRTLFLANCTVTDDGLKELAAFSSLQTLYVAECDGFTDAGMKHIGSLKQLRSVCVACEGLTDTGLAELAALEGLETLELHYSKKITGQGLKELARCPRLRKLTLSGPLLADAELARLKQLRFLYISNRRQLTWNAIEELMAAFPGCQIVGL